MIKAPLTELPIQKPQPQQIVSQLLAEEPLASDAVECAQHPRFEQLLGRDTWPSGLGIELVEQGRELFQNSIHTLLNSPQWMLSRHTPVEVNYSQEVRLSLRFSAHVDLIP